MQIHELNTFSGTPGNNNYLAIDDGTDTGKISGTNLLAPVNTRIDNIVSGLTVDAEVIDARLGADGVTYGSLGTAIRTQFTNVTDDIDQLICHNLMGNKAKTAYPVYIPVGGSFTISTSDGSVFSSSSTLRVYLYKADGTEMTWYGLSNNQSYRTITIGASYTDAYFLSWNEMPSVPLMVNYGSHVSTYEPYFESAPEELKRHEADIDRINAELHYLGMDWFAGEIALVGSGFVSLSGKITSSSNYKYVKYVPKAGSVKIRIDSIYVPTSASTLSTIAFFNSSNKLLESVLNTDINSTGAGNTFTNVEWDIPSETAYILISFGNMSSSTNFSTISEYGLYKPEETRRVFNQHVSGDWNQQFYLHCATSELGAYTSLSFNAKLHTSQPVLKYDIYFTGYDQNYTGRAFTVYKTSLTKGINGNEITIAENFQDTSKSIQSKYWTGVILNLYYAQPSLTSGRWVRMMNEYAVVSEYCLINNTVIELAQYPTAGYYVTSTGYHEPYNPMLGGYLCAIGDSLTAVYYKSEAESWVALIAQWNNMRYDNLGISGNPMAKTASYTEDECMAERVDDLDSNKYYTHIFVMGGANDYNFSIPIGQNTDTQITTFKGALNHIIETLTAKYPTAKIVFGTTYRRTSDYADKPYADAMLEVCALHSIPCLNNYENSGVQFFDANWIDRFGATNALGNNHLNAAGDLFVAPRFEHAMKYGIC